MPSTPRTDTAEWSLTDPANGLLHGRLPCPEQRRWPVQRRQCHEDHLHLPYTGVGPTQPDHVWFKGHQLFFQSRMPNPLAHHLLHPVRHKKANKRTRQSTAGGAYVMGMYWDDNWDLDCPGPSMSFVALAALMFLLGGVLDSHWQEDDPASVPLLTPHAGGGLNPPPLWVVHGRSAFDRVCKAVWGREEWAIVLLVPSGPAPRMLMKAQSHSWSDWTKYRMIHTLESLR